MPIESSLAAARLPSAKSILLLEEKSAAGDSHVGVLVERGYRVVLSHSGVDAHRSWKECRPDLVLLSFDKFDKGLFDFLEAIQSVAPHQRIAFIQDGNVSLAPVFQDNKLVRVAENAGDYLSKIDALLAHE